MNLFYIKSHVRKVSLFLRRLGCQPPPSPTLSLRGRSADETSLGPPPTRACARLPTPGSRLPLPEPRRGPEALKTLSD